MKDGMSKTARKGAYRVLANNTAEPAKLILRGLKTRLSRHFVEALPGILDFMDDALFDLAERGETNVIQSAYLDAMREIRIRRVGIEIDFRRALEDEIDKKCRRPAATGHRSGVSGQDGGLSLVDEAEMEERLAVTNSAAKMRTLCAESLYALNQRVALLLGHDDAANLTNPFDPITVCESFRIACRDASAEIKIKLILLKLFDRFICAGAPELYGELNRYLIGENILPDLRVDVKRRPHANADAAAEVSAVVAVDAQPYPPAGILNMLHQLLGSGPQAGAATVQTGVIIGLTELQRGGSDQAARTGGGAAGFETGTGNILHTLRNEAIGQGMAMNDAMILDIVAMMFDYILDDHNLPDQMKVLIGRLQLPILKVAMLDRTFFSRKFHPARQLLNRLAEASIGWDKDSDDSNELYGEVVQTVEGILSRFESDTSVFAQFLQTFEAFCEQAADSAGKKAGQAAKLIQRREALAESKPVVAQLLASRLKQDTFPLVHNFLDRYWRSYLVATRARYGQESLEWKVALKTLDGLLWSVAHKGTVADRERMLRILPTLHHNLEIGMQRVAMPEDEQAKFKDIISYYQAGAVGVPVLAAEEQGMQAQTGIVSLGAPLSEENTPTPSVGEVRHSMELDAGIGVVVAGGSMSLADTDSPTLESELRKLREAVQMANHAVHHVAVSREDCRDIGTTMVAARFVDDHVVMANVGDSRCYRLRGAEFVQLTTDHTVRQELVDQGFLSAKEAKESEIRNYVTRAVGVDESVEVDTFVLPVVPGDVFLLCSDGLTDLVDDDVIKTALIHGAGHPATAVAQLIGLANDNGGKDNISAILARVERPFPKLAETNVVTCLSGRLSMTGGTNVGRERTVNEDIAVTDLACGIAILADGMGGSKTGEIASRLAADTVRDVYRNGLAAAGFEQLPPSVNITNPLAAAGLEPPSQVQAEKLEKEMLALIAARPSEDEMIVFDPIAEQMKGIDSDLFEHPDRTEENAGEIAGICERVKNLVIGEWVEYEVDGPPPVRARLTWVSAVTDALVFTNCRGRLVTEVSRRTLVEDVIEGRARILDNAPLFDRAIGGLMFRLKDTG